mmetsp:Transcript_139/g.418  ORF Transcript_139/g.418 Transcript_139/m.418 type:complete len:216 (-) Transcript_139:747-1394(-)
MLMAGQNCPRDKIRWVPLELETTTAPASKIRCRSACSFGLWSIVRFRVCQGFFWNIEVHLWRVPITALESPTCASKAEPSLCNKATVAVVPLQLASNLGSVSMYSLSEAVMCITVASSSTSCMVAKAAFVLSFQLETTSSGCSSRPVTPLTCLAKPSRSTSGRCSAQKSATRCPSSPCPSNTASISAPFANRIIDALSWLGKALLPPKEAIAAFA